MSNKELHDFAAALIHTTYDNHGMPKAYLVTDTDEAHAQWLPASAVEIEPKNKTVAVEMRDGTIAKRPWVDVTMPARLAAEKKFI